MATEFIPDYTQLPGNVILQQVNWDNESALSIEQVTFGEPVATLDNPSADTELAIIPRPFSGLMDIVTISYNRVNLNQITMYLSIVFEKGSAIRISDLMPEINSRYEINIQPEDYYDAFLPALPGMDSVAYFTLKAKPLSLVWRGDVKLKVTGQDIPGSGGDGEDGLPSELPYLIIDKPDLP